MDAEIKAVIEALSGQEKAFNALYRSISSNFGLSECAMWVMYYLIVEEGALTQRDLIRLMMFPKQTINSAVTGLAEKGYLTRTRVTGARNRKQLTLTEAGRQFADRTVARLIRAESAALRKMTFAKMDAYVSLHNEYLEVLRESFEGEGLLTKEKA
jgi:DNA-binding MarR family transcriptional regulator